VSLKLYAGYITVYVLKSWNYALPR